MNPNRGESNFELPGEQLPVPSPEEGKKQEEAVEKQPARPETSGNRPKAPALPAIPDDLPVADQPVIAAPPQPVSPPPPAGAQASDQNPDHIEHIWVEKVRHVVAETRDDPYKQKNQMSKVKAEYIQKRFNKNIKTDEAPA